MRASPLEHDREAQLLRQAPIRGKGKNEAQGQASAGRSCALGSRLVLASQPCTSSVYTQRPMCLPTRPGQRHYLSLILDRGCGFSTGKRCQECAAPPPYPMAGQPGTERPCGPHDQFSFSQEKGISRDLRFCGHCWSKGERLWSLRGQERAKKLLLLEPWTLVSS